MATTRIRIETNIIKKLKNQYENKIIEEFGITPTASHLVLIALLEFEAMRTNRQVEIKIKKNAKTKYKFK